MSFVNTQYVTIAIIAIIIIAILLNRLNANFFKWVKSYWFFERTWTSRIATFFYTLSLFLFMLSLLDLRGPEKKIRASLPDQRTIIMLDTSTSMLAEDVRPSRFVKSIQLARHFVKNAAGHQISVVLFSDIQKRLLPFTDDIDLIDSRLAALEKTNTVSGGTNISQAIEEAIQYFEFDSSDDDKSKSGNMLVFTDAEESEGEFKVHVPSNVNLAMVGVGTLKGSNIPLRWEDGSFRGYKTFKGEPVVTKLDENYLRKMGKDVKSYKYWIANSYSLPTDELMNFFRAAYNKKQSTGDLRVRPVYSHYILIPAIVLYCLSVLIGRFALFKTAKSLMIIFLLGIAIKGQAEEGGVLVSPEIKKDLEVIKEGKADRKFTLKTAEKLLRTKDSKKATELYSEYSKKDDEEEVRFNYATSLLKSNRLKEAMPIYQDLLKNSKNEDLKKKVRGNLSHHLKKKEQEKEEKKNEKENQKNEDQNKQDQKDGKDDKKNDQKKEEENKKNGINYKNRQGEDQNNKKDNKDGKSDQDQKDQKDKKEGKDGKQEGQQKRPDASEKLGKERENKKEEKKDDKKDGKDKEKEKDKQKGQGEEKDNEDQKPQGPSTIEEKEKDIEQKRRMVKTPAMIKQIMSDDRELQKKMMDTSTSERGEQKPKRDW